MHVFFFFFLVFFFLVIRGPPRSTQSRSSAASDVYKRQLYIAIYRLQEHGYISPSETVVTESNRTRVYFSITEQGSRYLDDIIAEYRRVTQTIDSLLSKDGVLYEGDSV